MATVIRVNPAASPLRNVSFSGLASVAVGDRVPVRIELVSDARSGAVGYTPALFLGVRGTPLASVASWSASTVSGVAGWDGILRCDTSELADFVGLNASMTVMCQIVVEKNDTSELVTEAQNQVTVFSTVAPDGVYIPTPDTPTYSDLLALESTAVSAAAEASIDASLAASSAFAADSSADLADGYADAALSSAVAADGSADAALSSAVVADLEASVAVSAASVAVSVVPSISAELALRVIKDAAGNTERLNTVNFTVDPVGVTHSEGVAHWSPDDHCLELGTDQAGVYLQVGQESLVRVRNVTGSTLLNGKVVYINGSTGQRPTVALADNTVSASATKTIGVMTADLANNSDGYATTQGLVRDLNTSAFTDGATVYLGTAGNLTVTQPTAPNEIIRVGHVVKAHITQGILLVGVQHHQDASEVPLASIVGISATDVQGAVSELNSDITAETAARISADASLSTAVSAETSRAVSVEATKANANNGTHTGTTSMVNVNASGFITASTITNYAADVTVAAILALTPAQSAAKRKATVTGAYRMDGTLGRVEAWWDGDATAGTWEICGTEVPVTADFYTWASGYAQAQAPERQAANWPGSGNKINVERFLVRGDFDSSAYVAEASGAGGAVASAVGGNGYRHLGMTLGTAANAYTRTKIGSVLPRLQAGSTSSSALLDCQFIAGDDFAAEGAGLMVCLHAAGVNWASNASVVLGGLILCDPNNVFGYGPKTTLSAFCGGASGFSTSDGSAFTFDPTQHRLRVMRTGSVLRVYLDGVQVGSDITTNLQSLNNTYHVRVLALRPNSVGANTRLFRLQNATTIQVAP